MNKNTRSAILKLIRTINDDPYGDFGWVGHTLKEILKTDKKEEFD